MIGEGIYEIQRNLVIANFSSSFTCVDLVKAVSFMAGGLIGISIMVNQRTGSRPRRFVLFAVNTMTAMLTLLLTGQY